MRLEAGARERQEAAPLRQRQLRRRPSRELAVDLDLGAGRLAGELDAAPGPGARRGARRLVRLADGGRVVGLVQLDVDRRLARARERLRGARVAARLRDAPLQQLHAHVRRLVPHRRGQAIDDLAGLVEAGDRVVELERQEVGLGGAHQLVEAALVGGDLPAGGRRREPARDAVRADRRQRRPRERPLDLRFQRRAPLRQADEHARHRAARQGGAADAGSPTSGTTGPAGAAARRVTAKVARPLIAARADAKPGPTARPAPSKTGRRNQPGATPTIPEITWPAYRLTAWCRRRSPAAIPRRPFWSSGRRSARYPSPHPPPP